MAVAASDPTLWRESIHTREPAKAGAIHILYCTIQSTEILYIPTELSKTAESVWKLSPCVAFILIYLAVELCTNNRQACCG